MPTQPLDTQWEKLFREPPDAVTAYSASHVIYLKNTEVVGHSLSKSDLVNDKFEDVIFKDARFQRGTLTNVLFNGGSMEGTSFWGSTLTNVRFENMTITDSVFAGATMLGVTFKNCSIYNSKIHSLHTSKVTIEDSELSVVEFFDSELDITLRNTKIIEQGMFGGLKPGSRVTLENSYIGPYSDFSFSNIASFKAMGSELDRFSMGDYVGEVILDDSTLDFTLGSAAIDQLLVRNCNITRLSHGDALIKHASISDCKTSTEIYFIKSILGDLNIRNCDLKEFGTIESKINRINLSNSTFGEVVSQDMIAKELILHNMTFTGNTDFRRALADDTELFKVIFSPSATLDATGSNIPFKP